MRLTGWSYQTLMETPADVVHQMKLYLLVNDAIANKRELRFDD